MMATKRKAEAPYDPHEFGDSHPEVDGTDAPGPEIDTAAQDAGALAPVDNGEPFVPARTEEVIAEGRVVDRSGDMGLGRFIDSDSLDDDAIAETTYRAIISQVLASASIEEVLTPPEAVSARDVTGIPLVLLGFHVNTSEYDVGSPYYFSMDVKRGDTGEKLVVNSGNQRIMAQLLTIYMLDQLNSGKSEAEVQQAGVPSDARLSTGVEAYVRPAKKANRHGGVPLHLDSRPPEAWR